MGIVYFIVAIVATSVGALAGVGGGVFIKPVLDTIGQYNLSTIGLLSSFTVFSMAIVATLRQVKTGFVLSKSTLNISFGAIVGGVFGEYLFSMFQAALPEILAKGLQSLMLGLLLALIFFSDSFPKAHVKSMLASFFLGVVMGSISTFLGIGGGPVNVALMTIFLGMTIKTAAVNSILTILLAQAAQLLSILISRGFSDYDLSMLWYMIPASILGGFIGSWLNKKLSDKAVRRAFLTFVVVLALLNFINAARFLLDII